jgi:hypothetical protein
MPFDLNHGLASFFVDADWLVKFKGHELWDANWNLLVQGLRRELELSQGNAERLASAIVDRARLPQR